MIKKTTLLILVLTSISTNLFANNINIVIKNEKPKFEIINELIPLFKQNYKYFNYLRKNNYSYIKSFNKKNKSSGFFNLKVLLKNNYKNSYTIKANIVDKKTKNKKEISFNNKYSTKDYFYSDDIYIDSNKYKTINLLVNKE